MDIYVNSAGYDRLFDSNKKLMDVPWELDVETVCRIVQRNQLDELKVKASTPDCGFADYYLIVYHLMMAGF